MSRLKWVFENKGGIAKTEAEFEKYLVEVLNEAIKNKEIPEYIGNNIILKINEIIEYSKVLRRTK